MLNADEFQRMSRTSLGSRPLATRRSMLRPLLLETHALRNFLLTFFRLFMFHFPFDILSNEKANGIKRR